MVGIFRSWYFALGLSLGNLLRIFRLGPFGWDHLVEAIRLVSRAWDLPLEVVRVGSFDGFFPCATFAWIPSLGNVHLDTFARGLRLETFAQERPLGK